MNVDEALRLFAENEAFPREAMDWALAHWDEVSARFIARLRAFAAGGGDAVTEDQVFCIVHLCAQAHETRAYEPLCRMIAADPDIERWLGDAVTETLPGILINTFDGDLEPLTRAIESPKADEAARGSALAALGYLVRSKGAMGEEAMRAYLRQLRRDGRPREAEGLWLGWGETAAALGLDDLKRELVLLHKEGVLDPRVFGLDDFDSFAAFAHEDPTGLGGFDKCQVGPLDDAVGKLESWSWDGEDEAEDEEHGGLQPGPFDAPYVNPLRTVGRNDPCPCGSGKKYKKCCLPA